MKMFSAAFMKSWLLLNIMYPLMRRPYMLVGSCACAIISILKSPDLVKFMVALLLMQASTVEGGSQTV